MTKKDANDILREVGRTGLKEAYEAAEVEAIDPGRELEIGSDVEVADRVIEFLRRDFSHVVHSEGALWRWNGKHWQKVSEGDLYTYIKKFDGHKYSPIGSEHIRTYTINAQKTKSISQLIALELQNEDFFASPTVGINVQNGLIEFKYGSAKISCHDPEHRLRHVLNCSWNEKLLEHPDYCTLLGVLLEGCFKGDKDAVQKIDLVAEVAASAALGFATHMSNPKAVVFLGESAGNGKSTVLSVLRSMLPSEAVKSISIQQLSDDTMRATLPGVLLNTYDELGSGVIKSEYFKSIVTGDPTTARQVYQPPITFRPQAQHVFATNQLPPFDGGMDHGVKRRLMIIPFNRSIPEIERVADIDKLIIEEEMDLVLAWVVAGAVRLLNRGKFPELPSSNEALQNWISISDPIQAWIEEPGLVISTGNPKDKVHVKKAYTSFKIYANSAGIKQSDIPAQRTFTQRLKLICGARFQVSIRSDGNNLIGVKLGPVI